MSARTTHSDGSPTSTQIKQTMPHLTLTCSASSRSASDERMLACCHGEEGEVSVAGLISQCVFAALLVVLLLGSVLLLLLMSLQS